MRPTVRLLTSGVLKRVFGGRRGQATVELALIWPVFIALMLGVLEFGWVMFTHSRVSHAAEEGARRGMSLTRTAAAFTTSGNSDGTYSAPSTCTSSTIVGTIVCQIPPLNTSRVTVVLDTPTSTLSTVVPGLPVTVTVQYAYQPLTPIFPPLYGLVMSATATQMTQ